MNKTQLIEAMRKHIAQRSGIDFANYGDFANFNIDRNKIIKHGKDARRLLQAVASRDSLTVDDMVKELRSSGRLVLTDKNTLDYCTGQYFAVEYRAAACSRLASMLWNYWRESGYDTCEKIKSQARLELGRGIASRWFN